MRCRSYRPHIFQPTPLHEERREIDPIGTDALLISTHAPARGATTDDELWEITRREFQPTPLHEERLSAVCIASPWRNFNPRPCTRSDGFLVLVAVAHLLFQPTPLHEERLVSLQTITIFRYISTHAPARGATCTSFLGTQRPRNFNPRPCTRSDSV